MATTRLKNPPVYYVVGQVRFNPLMNLGEYLPRIQDAFRLLGYPDAKSTNYMSIAVSLMEGQPVPTAVPRQRHGFGNAARTHSFVLEEDFLALESTRYGTFPEFSELLLKGLELIHEKVELALINRVGLRYLDRIVPRGGKRIEDYLEQHVHGLAERAGGVLQHCYSETRAKRGNVTLVARTIIQEGPLGFPPDIAAVDLDVEARFKDEGGRHAVLDNDGFVEERTQFDVAYTRARLAEIHDVIAAAFKATATPYAFEEWNK